MKVKVTKEKKIEDVKGRFVCASERLPEGRCIEQCVACYKVEFECS